ncbi:unnamed protein product [Rotaria socialis]|nr:unnamed protein product [Rotaria socialis]CAF3347254.1 unnamed protein product [Rotaria socialis]CAF3422774.1 unnamed protein product [Rotaria socialis]CAF3655587.1 unnamed protein product [Rotaria socialis]
MLWENDTMLEHERLPVVAEADGSVCVTACCPLPVFPCLTCLYPASAHTWADLLPGRYNLTCRIRLRLQPVDHDCNAVRRIQHGLLFVDLFGDRIRPGGNWATLKCPWFEQEHTKHGDDT